MGTKYFVAAIIGAAFLLTSNVSFAGEDVEPSEEHRIAYGGKLYDNWLEITDAEDAPMGTNKAYPKGDKAKSRKAKSWMCISCHGWDYKGKDGQFGKDTEERNNTGIIGVLGAVGKDTEELETVITEKHGLSPDDDQIDEDEVTDLALFVSKGLIDTSKYIDDSGKGTGDAVKGKIFFNTLCGGCHGLDGKMITDMQPLAVVSTDNPWRSLHTIRNGRPGQPMPALRAIDEAIPGDILAYIQSLPK